MEVLVTAALVALVLALTGGALLFTTKAAAKTRAMIYRQKDIARVFAQMRQQLLNLYNSGHRKDYVLGNPGEMENRDEIFFLTSTPLYSQSTAEVGYKIMSDENGPPYLAYREFPFVEKEGFAESKWKPFSRQVEGMKIFYYQGDAKSDRWDNDGYPDKFEITLFYRDKDDPEKLLDMTFDVVPALGGGYW